MNQRALILVNASNLCIKQSANAALESVLWHEREFLYAVGGYPIKRRKAALERTNSHALAEAYSTTAVALIKRI